MSLPPFQINEQEWSALFDEPHHLFKLYAAIRRHMNYETGIAGLNRHFSEQFFREVFYVEPRPGRPKNISGSPTKKEIYYALEALTRIVSREDLETPLIIRRNDLGRFVFELPLATTDSSVQKQWGTNGGLMGDAIGDKKPPKKSSNNAGSGQSEQSNGGHKFSDYSSQYGTPPVSGIPLKDTPSLRSGGDGSPPKTNLIPLPASDADASSQPPKKKGSNLSPEMQDACRATWKAYSNAYFARYGAEPVRNARVNRNIVDLIKRIGMNDAPHVAAWYLTHNSAYYVRTGHSVGALLSDAEKLRTEWATGKRTTETKARQADRAATTASHVQDILSERRAKR